VKETFTKTSMVSAEGEFRAAEKMVRAAALISQESIGPPTALPPDQSRNCEPA